MPSVRSTMSCLMFAGQRLVAGHSVDHGGDFALTQPSDGERRDIRPPNPRRLKFQPVRNDQQNTGGLDPVNCTPSVSKLVGSIQ